MSRGFPKVARVETPETTLSPLRRTLHTIIFEADTPLGKFFDVGLLVSIVASVVVVCLESVQSISMYEHIDIDRVSKRESIVVARGSGATERYRSWAMNAYYDLVALPAGGGGPAN